MNRQVLNSAKIVGDVKNLEERMVSLDLKSKDMGYQIKVDFLLSLADEKFIRI